jgi:hypothetical protein
MSILLLLTASDDPIGIFNLFFNSIYVISCRLVSLFGDTGVLGEDHRPVAIH